MFSDKTLNFVADMERRLAGEFSCVDETAQVNSFRVCRAFADAEVAVRHFNPTTGYGYGDDGRDKLSALFASVFGSEAALVSPHIVSGTHAISLALFGILRPLDVMLCVTGRPYDTLCDTLGISGSNTGSSLYDFAVEYRQQELLDSGDIDVFSLAAALEADPRIKLVYLQRSRGYAWRSSLSIKQIREAVTAAKRANPDVIVMVDNCYGEFTELTEPTNAGADVIAGSLIKNPGGGLAPSGGYVAGRSDIIERISYRLTAPGLGSEVGSYAASYQPYYQGLFMAPHTVAQALKGAMLFSAAFETLGFECNPTSTQKRSCITQSIKFNDSELLLKFMRAIQSASPVDSSAVPLPWDMPGYDDQVVMAAGTFVSGASIELSADGPLKPPYIAYFQGGLTYEHCKYALFNVLEQMDLVGAQ